MINVKNEETKCGLSLKVFSLWTSLSTEMFLIKANKLLLFKQSLTTNAYALPMPSEAPVTTKTEMGTRTSVINGFNHLSNSHAFFILNTGGALCRNSTMSSPLPCCQRKPRTVFVFVSIYAEPNLSCSYGLYWYSMFPSSDKEFAEEKTRTACFQWFPTLPSPPDPD